MAWTEVTRLKYRRGQRVCPPQQCRDLVALVLAKRDATSYVYGGLQGAKGKPMNHLSAPDHATASPAFSAKQGQYLAFIHTYTLVLGRPPAEADLQRHFRVTPPSVHGMVHSLERSGLFIREPGRARSIVVLVDPQILPLLQPSQIQPVKTTVTSY